MRHEKYKDVQSNHLNIHHAFLSVFYPLIVPTQLEELLAAQAVLLDHTTPTLRTADATALLLAHTPLDLDTRTTFPVLGLATNLTADTRIALRFHPLGKLCFTLSEIKSMDVTIMIHRRLFMNAFRRAFDRICM